jgi:hypothetical protein
MGEALNVLGALYGALCGCAGLFRVPMTAFLHGGGSAVGGVAFSFPKYWGKNHG